MNFFLYKIVVSTSCFVVYKYFSQLYVYCIKMYNRTMEPYYILCDISSDKMKGCFNIFTVAFSFALRKTGNSLDKISILLSKYFQGLVLKNWIKLSSSHSRKNRSIFPKEYNAKIQNWPQSISFVENLENLHLQFQHNHVTS